MGAKPTVVVLTPVFNEQEGFPSYLQAVRQTFFSRNDYDFQIILIDDGSSDDSWALIRSACQEDPRFRGIRLSRNFGSHVALSAGFWEADGDAVATLACDLQDPPEVILEFLEQWRGGAQIVWGKRESRGDSWWRVLASNVFFYLIKKFAMPRGSKFTTGSFLLADRHVVECFRQFREYSRITFALIAWTGFDQAVVPYHRKHRAAGKSGWNFGLMIRAMYDTFIGFSDLPINLLVLSAMATFALAFASSFYFIVRWVVEDPLPGWTGIMVGLSFFFGIQFLLLSIIGEYLKRIYNESVSRPLFFISGTAGKIQRKDARE